MNHIGKIIKKYRDNLGMSQKDLAENICSPKYIYLIEKEKRTPSAALLRSFSNRLGVDLFEMYHYLDCENPIEVSECILLFEQYKRTSDFESLKKLTHQKSSCQDFKRCPWAWELRINQYIDMIFIQGMVSDAAASLEKTLKEIHKASDYHLSQFYVLLSMSYLLLNDAEKSQEFLQFALALLKNKESLSRYKYIVVIAKTVDMVIKLMNKHYDELIDEGLALLQYQKDNGINVKIHYTYFLLGIAYYLKDMNEDTIHYINSFIYCTLTDYNPKEAAIFARFHEFSEILQKGFIDCNLANRFREKYVDPFKD